MEKIIDLCDKLTNFFGAIAGILMLFSVLLIIGEIIVRTFLNSTLYITEEYTGYLMAAVTFLGLAYTLKERGHIRLVFLHTILSGRSRVVLDIYGFLVGTILFAIITGCTMHFFWDSVVTGTRSMQISSTYLAIPQSVLPLGSIIMTLQFAAEFFRSILLLRTGAEVEHELESSSLGR